MNAHVQQSKATRGRVRTPKLRPLPDENRQASPWISRAVLLECDVSSHRFLSLCISLEPFAPKLRSTVRIRTGVTVKCADECSPLCHVRRFPVLRFRWPKHVISVSKQLLALHDVL